MTPDLDRRAFIKGAGVAGAAALAPGTASAIDDSLDTEGGVQEIIVVFHDDADASVLDQFGLPDGYHAFEVLPFAYARATGEQIQEIAALDEVRYVQKNEELELHNDDSRELTGADVVHDKYDVTGDGVHAVVIDTGLTTHPDLMESLEHNFHFVDPLTTDGDQMWVDVDNADIDDVGHGSHVTGSLAGDGTMSDGQYAGTAPDTTITAYKTNVAGALYVIYLLAAIEDVLQKQRDGEFDVHIVNNSFGASNDGDFNPADATNIAYWEAFKRGIVPVFSAGNSGPDHGTLNYLGKQPYSLCVAATHTGDAGAPKEPTSFSSRGRPPEEDADEDYVGNYDFDRYEFTEGPHYDRREALQNVRDFHASGQDGAEEVATREFSVTVETTASDPTAWTAVVDAVTGDLVEVPSTFVGGDAVYVELDDEKDVRADAGYLDAVFEVGPLNRESVYVSLYRGDRESVEEEQSDAVLVASDGNIVRDGPLELEAPIDGDATYTLEFTGFNNVETEIEATLRWLDTVPRPEGPFGLYRCSVGAPGNLITSTNKPTEIIGAIGILNANPWYADASGTSMSCPLTAGVVSLVLEAYKREAGHFPKPIDAINIIEATAEGGTPRELVSHTEANMGAGFVDAKAAVDLAMELGAEAAEDKGRGPPEDTPGEGEGPPDDEDHPGRGLPDREEDPAAARHPELWDEVELCSFGEPEETDGDDDTGDYREKGNCIHVVEAAHIDELTDGRSFQVGGGVLLISSPTPSFHVPEGAFSKTDLPKKRLWARMTWNPTDEGPTNANLFAERRTDDGWEVIGYAESEAITGGHVAGENAVVLTAVDGKTYAGTDGDGTTGNVENDIVIEGGNDYRFRVQGQTGIQDFEITAEVQSFDRDCLDEE